MWANGMTKTLLAMIALALAAPLQAAPFEDIATLEARVIGALDAGIGAPGGPIAPIDRRLKLAACPAPATIDPPALGAVALRCAALGWRIRVPLNGASVAANSQKSAEKSVPTIRRGDPVQLIADAGSFSVSSDGIADEDGVAGQRIRIKTDRARPPIVGEVVDIGLVRLAGFK